MRRMSMEPTPCQGTARPEGPWERSPRHVQRRTAGAMRRDPRQGEEGASTWESGLATQVTTRVALRYR